jgi:hypothetical protein
MTSTLKQQLVKYMQTHSEWVNKGVILSMTWKDQRRFTTYLPDTVSRKLREAESESLIAVKSDGKTVQYKWIPFEMRKRYIPKSERLTEALFIPKSE